MYESNKSAYQSEKHITYAITSDKRPKGCCGRGCCAWGRRKLGLE